MIRVDIQREAPVDEVLSQMAGLKKEVLVEQFLAEMKLEQRIAVLSQWCSVCGFRSSVCICQEPKSVQFGVPDIDVIQPYAVLPPVSTDPNDYCKTCWALKGDCECWEFCPQIGNVPVVQYADNGDAYRKQRKLVGDNVYDYRSVQVDKEETDCVVKVM